MLGNGDLDKLKHQQNLLVLEKFKDIIQSGILDVHNILGKLKSFKAEANELKSTVTEIEFAESMSLEAHTDVLKHGIERLKKLKRRLDGRMKTEQLYHSLDDDDYSDE